MKSLNINTDCEKHFYINYLVNAMHQSNNLVLFKLMFAPFAQNLTKLSITLTKYGIWMPLTRRHYVYCREMYYDTTDIMKVPHLIIKHYLDSTVDPSLDGFIDEITWTIHYVRNVEHITLERRLAEEITGNSKLRSTLNDLFNSQEESLKIIGISNGSNSTKMINPDDFWCDVKNPTSANNNLPRKGRKRKYGKIASKDNLISPLEQVLNLLL